MNGDGLEKQRGAINVPTLISANGVFSSGFLLIVNPSWAIAVIFWYRNICQPP